MGCDVNMVPAGPHHIKRSHFRFTRMGESSGMYSLHVSLSVMSTVQANRVFLHDGSVNDQYGRHGRGCHTVNGDVFTGEWANGAPSGTFQVV